jgi:hypothetical protein
MNTTSQEITRSCQKCNFYGPANLKEHKEYCRRFQHATKKLNYFPRNSHERQRDTALSWEGFHEEEMPYDKAIYFMGVISCVYDELVEMAIEKANWQCIMHIKKFAVRFAIRQHALGVLTPDVYYHVTKRMYYDY